MVRKFRMVVGVLSLLVGLGSQAAIRTWSNAAGDGDWHNTANWANGTLPTASDIASVTIAADTTLTITNEAKVAMFLASGTGTLTVNSGAGGDGSIYVSMGKGSYRQAVFSNAVAAVYNVPVKLRATDYEVWSQFLNSATFNRRFTLAGGATWYVRALGEGSILTFNDEFDATDQTVVLYGTSAANPTFRLNGKVTAKTFGEDNNASNSMYLYATNNAIGALTVERFGRGYLKTANALSDQTVLRVGEKEKDGVLYLYGDTQVANRLTAVSASVTGATAHNNYCLNAQETCTLTLKGSANAKTTTGLTGPLSLVWDPTEDFTQSFTNHVLGTTGSITVKRGAVALTGTSSAPNLTGIKVAAGASMKFLTSTASPLTAGKCAAKIAAEGTIDVGADVTVAFADVMYDGAHVKFGTYVAKDSESTDPNVKKVDWVTGEGCVTVNSGTKAYWTGESGNWSNAALWTSGVVPGAGTTAVVLEVDSTEDRTLTVDEPVALSVPIRLCNAGGGRSILSLAAQMKLNVQSKENQIATVENGGCLTVGVGGTLTVDGEGKGIDESLGLRCFLIDGGELRVTGGTVAFTNMPSCVDVCGSATQTGRVTMTSGEISFNGNHAGTSDDNARLRFRPYSHANFTGGTYLYFTETTRYRVFGDGGRVDVAGGVITIRGKSSPNDFLLGSGEMTYGGTTPALALTSQRITIAPNVSGMSTILRVTDAASINGSSSGWWKINGTSSALARLIWDSTTRQSTGYGLYVGAAAGTGELEVRKGYLTTSYYGLEVGGTPDRLAEAPASPIVGKLTVSGGALYVQGRDKSGYAKRFTGLSVGDGTCTSLTGTSRPVVGTVELTGGAITNSDSHVMVGGGFGEGTWRQTGGELVDKKDLWIGAAGGLGTYAMGGGTATVSGRLYVGGMHTNRCALITQECIGTGWPIDRHDAVGTLCVSGGTMSVTGDCFVGVDGAGTIEMNGSAGALSVANLILSNETASVVRFVADANGVSPITVKTKLTVTPGTKLFFDLGAAAAADRRRFTLISCKSMVGSFDPANVTLTGGQNLLLRQTATGIAVVRRHGIALIVR